MQPVELANGDVLLCFDGAVAEVFHTAYDRSYRIPAAWAGVQVEARKHDQVRFTIGRAADRAGAVYGPDVNLAWVAIRFELAATEEPSVRGFFDEVARAAGRG